MNQNVRYCSIDRSHNNCYAFDTKLNNNDIGYARIKRTLYKNINDENVDKGGRNKFVNHFSIDYFDDQGRQEEWLYKNFL